MDVVVFLLSSYLRRPHKRLQFRLNNRLATAPPTLLQVHLAYRIFSVRYTLQLLHPFKPSPTLNRSLNPVYLALAESVWQSYTVHTSLLVLYSSRVIS